MEDGKTMNFTAKQKSQLYTIIGFLITTGATITADQWLNILPTNLVGLAPILVAAFGFILAQWSEEKRVNTINTTMVEESNTTAQEEEDGI